jgi:hypothetical protein
MASVRMTNELRDTIRRNAENAYDLANPEPKPSTEYIDRVRKAVINSPAQKFLKDMAELGAERGITKLENGKQKIVPFANKDPITGVDLKRKAPSQGNPLHAERHTIKFATQMHKYYVTEENYNRWGNPDVWVEDFEDDDRLEIMDLFAKHEAAHDTWFGEKQSYERSIRDLLDSVTTLKQLFEIWPAAESLVPADKIQKMHTKENRKQQAQRVREEVNFDPTIANQAVLTAKMLGG